MIYSHKPQRSGRSIAANTNNPPQDPPPPPEIIPKDFIITPDVLIEDSTPPVLDLEPQPTKVELPTPEIKAPEITTPPQPHKLSWFRRLYNRIVKLFRRK